ncbi:unnamed protein product [Ectocarpus sp. 6 AP-2014]
MVQAVAPGRALTSFAVFSALALRFCSAFVAPQLGGPAPLRAFLRRSTPTFARAAATASIPPVNAGKRPTSLMMAGEGGKTRVLFVCLGNICRSPTAEAVFKQVTSKAGDAAKFEIDSCGTGGGNPSWYKEGGGSYHTGDSPDARMTAAAAKRGVMLSGASRPLTPGDFDKFDLVVGMDAANTKAMSTAAEHWGKSQEATSKLRTMTSYCRSSGDVKSVPDPYYGGPQGFETVLDLLDDACQGLLEKCRAGDA